VSTHTADDNANYYKKLTWFSPPHPVHHHRSSKKDQSVFLWNEDVTTAEKRIPSLANLSYPERLAALDLEPLELSRLKSYLVLYYKCLHDLVALPSSEYFTVSNVPSQTRTGGNRLLRPLCSTKLYENDFFNHCVSCWNFLPYTVVKASSISCFKRLLSNVDLSSFACCTYFNNL